MPEIVHVWRTINMTSIAITAAVVLSAAPARAQTRPINGICGSANGAYLDNSPTTGLCSSGDSSAESGSGPWYWTCYGSRNGTDAQCSAFLADPPPVSSTGQASGTTAGVPLAAGWTLRISDRFGTNADNTIQNYDQLHGHYNEGKFYNVDANGRAKIPNAVVNGDQQTYVHFEDAIVFAADHLTIQGRGHPDGSISSAQMTSVWAGRNFCVEARYRIPNADKSWPAFWFYAEASGNDNSELDVEQPITPNQGVQQVSFYNHPNASSVTIYDSRFTTKWMTRTDSGFDASAAAHYYTVCYDDAKAVTSRFIDGQPIYSASWKWNASLGGTGHGPDAVAIIDLEVGGVWPGNLASPAAYVGDLEVYSIEYYGP